MPALTPGTPVPRGTNCDECTFHTSSARTRPCEGTDAGVVASQNPEERTRAGAGIPGPRDAFGAPSRFKGRVRPRWVAFSLIAASVLVSSVVALTITTVAVQRLELFGNSVSSTDLTVTALASQIKGKNRVDTTLTVRNDDAGAGHLADITVQLLNASGDLLSEQTQAAVSFAAGETKTLPVFSMGQTNIGSDYASTLVLINQTG